MNVNLSCVKNKTVKFCCCLPGNCCSTTVIGVCSNHTHSPNTFPRLPSHHGDPAQAGDALAHSREVVEQRRRAVLLAEALDLLDDFRHGLQQRGENCLKKRRYKEMFRSDIKSLSARSMAREATAARGVFDLHQRASGRWRPLGEAASDC